MSSQLRNNADVIDEDRDIGHLVRVGVSAQKYGIALFHVTQKYNWTKNFVLNTLQGPGIDYRETNEVSDFLAQGIYDGMADQFSYTNLTFKHIRFYNSQAIDDEKHRLYCDPANCPQSEEQCMKKCCESFDYKKYLERIRSEGRIIIITADYGLEKCDYLGDFFEAAWQEGFWDEDGHSEFVFILIDFQELDIDRLQEKLPLESPIRTLGMSREARKWSHIFQSMVILRPQRPSGPKFDKFAKELWEFTKKRKHKIESHARYFNDSHTIEKLEEFNAFESYFDPRRNLYLGYTYDSIKLYETVLKRFFDSSDSTIADVFLNTNGFMVAPRGLAAVKQYIRGKKFPSVMSESDFRIDEHGDRDIDFEFLSFNGGHFERSGIFIGEMSKYEIQRHIRFNTKDGLPPLDTPKCGFLGEKCKKLLTKTQLMLIVTGCVILVLLLTVAYITRLYIHEKQLSNEWWRIHWHDLEMENEINDYDRQLQNKSFKQMDFYGGDEISQRFGNFYAFRVGFLIHQII
ncbi:Oidioi.mRNA.OKI2018_I69.XSR.g15618.t1.cds [Oikopleura dioica]|uniref:Oidioi.mRNA.OKI2018_I69.XSR.g15618.t1.cds n=1 Tax=Oikopleura dioica TaxID=34765 RepID=A0ABN7SJU1_OIKDI|nr:Oidioi.mRNA.OKI2018_I69.XSR.g15618.t1.cds [Oikopleura dioica]